MTAPRKVNEPIEVWQDREHPEELFQVLEHLEPDELGPRALIAISTPQDLSTEGEIVYMDTVRNTCTLVWTEEDGPLPEEYRFEEE